MATIRCANDIIAGAADFGFIELINAANALAGCGTTGPGQELYETWLRHHPADPLRYAAYFNYGVLSGDAGDPAQAVRAYDEATRLAPNFLPAYVNSGLALERMGRLGLAIEQWQHVAERLATIDGDCIGLGMTALRNIARAAINMGDYHTAEAAIQRCLEVDPHQRDAISSRIVVRQLQCKWPVLSPCGRLTRAAQMAAITPMSLAILADDPIFQLANAWRHAELDVIRLSGPHVSGRWVLPDCAPFVERPLRIGYISSDLREHAIGYLIAELFDLHNRARVEVFAYSNSKREPDPMQARITRAVDHWTDFAGWSDKAKACRIVHDEIDILVDIDGHTEDVQANLFALRPAPVIVNWLGYPGSMGTPHHQYIIADPEIIPPDHEKYYSERVLRLPCYQPTDRRRAIAQTPSRSAMGLSEGAMVYCCFNATHKITSVMFRSWMTILARVPHAVLWLLSTDAATDERLRQQAVSHDISADRLVFAERRPNAEHLARYPLADLFLDTSPYGRSPSTASDALWMGVPVLTIVGLGFAARVCTSLVRAAGLAELACDGPGAYEDRAVELGTRPDILTAFREWLRVNRDHCTLFDMPLLVTRLEALYEQMWDEYRSGCIPEPDLANLAIYNEIGGGLDHEAAVHRDLRAYEEQYATALVYRRSISPIPRDRRLCGGP